MRLQAMAALAVAGLILAGGGIAAASNPDHPSGNGAHPASGRVVGKLEREGGPIGPGGKQPPVVPLSGTVVFWRRAHRTVRVEAGKSGRFSVRLAPGHYAVWGRVQGYPRCRLPGGLTVSADRTEHVVVACIVP